MTSRPTPAATLLTPAQRALIERSIPLVRRRAAHWARRYDGLLTREDAEGAGKIGLMEAVHRYDPQRDDVFEGFTLRWIDGRILDLIQDHAAARSLTRGLYRAGGALGSLPRRDYNIMTEDEASLTERLLRFASELAAVAFLGGVAGVGGIRDVAGLLGARPAGDEDGEQETAVALALRALAAALTDLDPDERAVIEALYTEGMTLHEAAAAVGLTYKQVRNREARGLKKLRTALERLGLRASPPPLDVPGVSPVLRGLQRPDREREP